MQAGRKFLLGAAVIVSSVGFLITEGVKQTGVYFLTPAELSAKTAADFTSEELERLQRALEQVEN